jgi:hypothetical protein
MSLLKRADRTHSRGSPQCSAMNETPGPQRRPLDDTEDMARRWGIRLLLVAPLVIWVSGLRTIDWVNQVWASLVVLLLLIAALEGLRKGVCWGMRLVWGTVRDRRSVWRRFELTAAAGGALVGVAPDRVASTLVALGMTGMGGLIIIDTWTLAVAENRSRFNVIAENQFVLPLIGGVIAYAVSGNADAHRDFFAATAGVIPVLLLALLVESRAFQLARTRASDAPTVLLTTFVLCAGEVYALIVIASNRSSAFGAPAWFAVVTGLLAIMTTGLFGRSAQAETPALG